MAITGSGTSADPWLVHSYSELKNAINGTAYGANKGTVKFYVTLDSDIDCNSYGESFEWQTIEVFDNASNFVLDLGGHTIKNFKVASGNTVFTFGGGNASTIKNGKILNVFLSGAAAFCKYKSGIYVYSSFQDLSISVNLGSGTSSTVFACGIARCAIYAEGSATQKIVTTWPDIGATITDSDFLFNLSAFKAFEDVASSGHAISRCRIRGTALGSTMDYLIQGTIENSVIDLITDAHYSAYNSNSRNASTIINSTKAYNVNHFQNMISVTSEEIVNGDSLRAKGFEVVNVSA